MALQVQVNWNQEPIHFTWAILQVLHCCQCPRCPEHLSAMLTAEQNHFHVCLDSHCFTRTSQKRWERHLTWIPLNLLKSAWMSFCIESQGRGHGNDPPGTSLTQQKQQSLSPALLLQALTAQSPPVDPCWPHMQATCDAELFAPPPVPLSSCGRVQPAEQTARTGEKSQVNTGSLRFTSFPLTEVVYSFYFTSSRRAGKEKSCSDWVSTTLVQLVKTISTLGTWNWSLLKTLIPLLGLAMGTLVVLGNRSWAGQSSPVPLCAGSLSQGSAGTEPRR